jgi:hypothetical protein
MYYEKRNEFILGMVVHIYNLSTPEMETGGS